MSTTIDATGVVEESIVDTSGIAGHPRGLLTLSLTETWERFSYYGLRAILLLYMTSTLAQGGLAFDKAYAGLILGTYTSSVYWTPLIGGWLADRVFGARRAVFIGGIIIACGHFSMFFRTMPNFYGGLALIALGTGLLKPNISAMVGDLYPEGDKRRDAGFSIFYMGINLGAFGAPLVCGYLAQRIDWHYGFGAAGVGMVIGLIVYVLGGKPLQRVGNRPVREIADIAEVKNVSGGTDYLAIVLSLVGALIGFSLGYYFGDAGIVSAIFPTVVGFFAGYIAAMVRHLSGEEAKRVTVIFILFLFSIVFWMSFEQASSSLTLFADRLTRLNIFGFSFPSSWFQSVQPIFIILLAPVFAGIWLKLGKRDPSSPTKFALGLLFAAIAFAIVTFASTLLPPVPGDQLSDALKVSPLWLVSVYFFQTLGELCLSPVGLSTVTKLSPGRMVGLMMGVWFLSLSIGNFLAGMSTRFFDENAEGALLHLFGAVAAITLMAAILLVALTPAIKRLTPKAS
jgi:POT family proton-dependent oligopeptide transporter